MPRGVHDQHPPMKHFYRRLAALAAAVLLAGCAGLTAHSTGLVDGRLTACPPAPRCVSSDGGRGDHHVAPLSLAADTDRAWARIGEVVAARARTVIVERRGDYLHAEVTSPWGVYTDDLELVLRREERTIGVRSSARIGYYDFGVNRERIESLRAELAAAGLVKGSE